MNTADLLKKFLLDNETLDLIRKAGKVLKPRLEDFVGGWYEWLEEQPEFEQFFPDPENVERVKGQQLEYWREFLDADVNDQYLRRRHGIAEVHARIGLPMDIYIAGMSKSHQLLVAELRSIKKRPAKFDATLDAIAKLIFFDGYIVNSTYDSIKQEKITEHSKAMMEMATPVTAIWEGILLLPLVGIIDSHRTQDIMNKTLEKISETRAKAFVLDISGVAAVDTGVANHLIKITQATRLMGCESIVSGISPAIARTLVELGVNVGEVQTTATLRDAFELALRNVGEQIGEHNE